MWVLIILAVIIVAVGSEAARVYMGDNSRQAPSPADESAQFNPPFKVGDLAPDFSLKDKDGRPHSLSSLVKKKTLLCFICGCQNCRNMQNYLQKCFARLGDQAPAVISVATIDPAAETSYRREVKLPQTILYENRPDPTKVAVATEPRIMDIYKGHPCPRLYLLNPDRKVAWIGKSPGVVNSPGAAYQAAAQALGMRVRGDVNAPAGSLEAPEPDFGEKVSPTTQIPAHTVPGH